MNTQAKNPLFGWMWGFRIPSQYRCTARQMLCTIVLLTAAPAAVLHAATPPTLGTSFPLYVLGEMNSDTGVLGAIVKLDSTGAATPFVSGGTLTYPCFAAFDGSGNLYTVNQCFDLSSDTGNITRLNAAGTPTVFASGGNLVRPGPLAFDASGNLYVGDLVRGSIVKLDSQGTQTVVVPAFSSFATIYGIAIDNNGILYFTAVAAGDASTGIYRLEASGSTSLITSTGSASGVALFTGLAFDANGSLFATQITEIAPAPRTGTVFKLDSTGHPQVFASGGNLINPLCMAFDASGNLYVLTTGIGPSGTHGKSRKE